MIIWFHLSFSLSVLIITYTVETKRNHWKIFIIFESKSQLSSLTYFQYFFSLFLSSPLPLRSLLVTLSFPLTPSEILFNSSLPAPPWLSSSFYSSSSSSSSLPSYSFSSSYPFIIFSSSFTPSSLSSSFTPSSLSSSFTLSSFSSSFTPSSFSSSFLNQVHQSDAKTVSLPPLWQSSRG